MDYYLLIPIGLTVLAWAVPFLSREARTARFLVFMLALTVISVAVAVRVLPFIFGIVPLLLWYFAMPRGARLGLFALTPAEDELNERLRSISKRAATSGSPTDLVSRPPEYDTLMTELASLVPPDVRWARVIRLMKEYLRSLPTAESGPVWQGDRWVFHAWRGTWFDTHDRRILFAPRPDSVLDFKVDLLLAMESFYRRLGHDGEDGARAALASLERLVPPNPAWARIKTTTLTFLGAVLERRTSGRNAIGELRYAAALAEAKTTWPESFAAAVAELEVDAASSAR